MALATCANLDVLQGSIRLPLRGVWSADLVLDGATVPSGAVTLAAKGGLSLRGTVVRGGVFLDAAHVRVVGGAGGLAREVAGAYQSAQLRDPLDAILRASGETLSSTVTTEVLTVSLSLWTLGRHRAARALDELAHVASLALAKAIGWRLLPVGSLWIGAESWSAATLPAGADVLERCPAEQRLVIGAETPALLPGVDLPDVGKVVAVEHWLTADRVRTWAWT